MPLNLNLKTNVRKFTLDYEDEREEYENVVNNEDYIVYKENFTYDKAGRAIITIWFYGDIDED